MQDNSASAGDDAPPVIQSASPTRAPGRGPRRLNLLGTGVATTAPSNTAPAVEGDLDDAALAKARIDGWLSQAGAQTAHRPHVSVGTKELGTRLQRWFVLPTELQERLFPLPMGTRLMLISHSSRVCRCHSFVLAPARTTTRCVLWRWLLRMTHDVAGRPVEWTIVQSSGDYEFDAKAVEAIRSARLWAAMGTLAQGKVADWSKWIFSAEANNWSRTELILDPFFTPDGQVLEQESGVRGVTSVTRKVVLIAIRYAS
ncbi:MAG: energy transducer TonB [Myxococcota bacterium]